MRFHRPLDHVLGTKSKVAVLRHLVQNDLEQSGREIARAIGLSPKPLNEVLAQLTDEGLLLQRNIGRVYLFRLNRNNRLVAELVVPLFEGEKELLNRALTEVFENVPDILSVILYGSVSRGEEGPFSDIDLLVVTDDGAQAEEILEERAVAFLRRYGNLLSFIVMSSDEFRQDYREGDDFLREVLSTDRVITGRSPWDVLHGTD